MRGSQLPQLSGQFFDATAVFPGEGEWDGFTPHFIMKTRVMTKGKFGEKDFFASSNGVEVKYDTFFTRKGAKEINDNQEVQQIQSANYVLAAKNDPHVWAYIPSETVLEGTISDIKNGFYTRPGNKIVKTFQLGLKDEEANEYYRIDLRYNYTTFKFFNSLLSLGENMIGKKVKITLAFTVDKVDKSLKYSTIYFNILENGKYESIKWAYNKNEDGTWTNEQGEVMPTDSTANTTEFFVAKFTELEELFSNAQDDNDNGEPEDAENVPSTQEGDDIPF